MKNAIAIFIRFLHDFAAGCWAATVLAVCWVDRIALQCPELKPVLDGLERHFLWAGEGRTAVDRLRYGQDLHRFYIYLAI